LFGSSILGSWLVSGTFSGTDIEVIVTTTCLNGWLDLFFRTDVPKPPDETQY
jgi:hypothetical protein